MQIKGPKNCNPLPVGASHIRHSIYSWSNNLNQSNFQWSVMNPKNFEEALYFYYDSQILPKFDHVHDIHSWILDTIVHRNCLFTPDARSLNARDMEDLCRHAVFFLSPFAENREVHPFCRLSCWNRIQPHIALKNPPENGLKFDFLLGDTCKLHMSTRKKILKNLREKTIQKLVTENHKSLQPEVCWFSVLNSEPWAAVQLGCSSNNYENILKYILIYFNIF